MADAFSPWVPQNKITPAQLDPAWQKTLTPAQQKNMAWMRGSFAGDDPNQQPIGLGHLQGQGTTITAPLPKKPAPAAPKRLRAAPPPLASATPPPAAPVDDGEDIESTPSPDDTLYRDLILKLQNPDFSAQQGGIDELNGLYDHMKNKEQETDYSPLLAYHDSHYGTNLAKGYRAPMNEDDRLKAEADLQNAIQKNRQGLSEDQVATLNDALQAEGHRLGIYENAAARRDNLNATLATKSDLADAALNSREKIASGHDATSTDNNVRTTGTSASNNARTNATKVQTKGMGLGDVHKYQNEYNGSVKKLNEGLGNLDVASQQLELAHQPGGNPNAAGSLPIYLASTIANRLNQNEINALGGKDNASIKNRVEAAYAQAANGQMTDENYKFIKQFISTAKGAKERLRQEALAHHASQYQIQHPEKSQADAMKEVGGIDYQAPSAAPAGTPAAPSAPNLQDAAKAELLRRQGK